MAPHDEDRLNADVVGNVDVEDVVVTGGARAGTVVAVKVGIVIIRYRHRSFCDGHYIVRCIVEPDKIRQVSEVVVEDYCSAPGAVAVVNEREISILAPMGPVDEDRMDIDVVGNVDVENIIVPRGAVR